MNPYRSLPEHHFWRRSISAAARAEFNPVVSTKFKIAKQDRIATAGSCFAQHISRKLDQIGFNYFVTETGDDLPPDEAAARNYRVFSARFGNVYTTRQLLQLFEEAYGRRQPAERVWQRTDGRFVDPYRPAIEPDGYATPADVLAARRHHLACVRRMFEEADLFIFTLGLTETWTSGADGSSFPVAPGVSGGEFDPQQHGFTNLTVADVEGDLAAFLDGFKQVNPNGKVLFTVSPVPLIATYEPRNVLVSTTYSKSVLRVAVERFWRELPWVDYFPSFEIITGSFNGGAYFAEDGREVNAFGVAHAMRCFVQNYVEGIENPAAVSVSTPSARPAPQPDQIVCDEEAINQANN